jgi:DNA polymerase III epsilon subunit-like protein
MKVHDIYLDSETTGLCAVEKGTEKPGKHDLIQLGAICGPHIMEGKCQPIRWDSISQQALDVHGYQVADLRQFQPSGELCVKFRHFLANIKERPTDMFRMVAHNMPFDYKFFRSWFLKNGFGDWDTFFLPQAECICTKKLGNQAKKAGKLPGIENMKLITAAKYINFKFDAHDALGDTYACRAWHEHLKMLAGYVEQTGGVSAAELRAEGKEPLGTDEAKEEVVGKLEL